MNWKEFGPIAAMIQDALPPYVFAHTIPRGTLRTSMKLILCDWDETTKYFEKTYSIADLTTAQVTMLILKDIHKFNNYWNSPLMKALR